MTAMWKKSALEQAQKRSSALDKAKQIAELKHEMKVLQNQLRTVRAEKDQIHNSAVHWRQTADDARKDKERYEFLRDQELMIMNKDGAQYLKGEDLDKYVDKELLNMPIRYWGSSMSTKYAQALAASMAQTKQAVVEQMLNNQYVLKTYPMSFTVTEDTDNGIDP